MARVVVSVSVQTAIGVVGSFDLYILGLYLIPPINSTQNYAPPQRESTLDLSCDCDSVMYRCASISINSRGDGLIDRGGCANIQSLYGVHSLSGRCDVFVSIRSVCILWVYE